LENETPSLRQQLRWAWIAGLRKGKKQTRQIWEDRTTWTVVKLREDGFSWRYIACVVGVSIPTLRRWFKRRIYYKPLEDFILADQSVQPWGDEAGARRKHGVGGAKRMIRMVVDNEPKKD